MKLHGNEKTCIMSILTGVTGELAELPKQETSELRLGGTLGLSLDML